MRIERIRFIACTCVLLLLLVWIDPSPELVFYELELPWLLSAKLLTSISVIATEVALLL